MLGFIGFTIAAVLIGIFAVSFNRSFQELAAQRRNAFTVAFLLLAVSLFIWGLAPLLNDALSTKVLVFTGDVLLLLGTGLLILSQVKKAQTWVLIVLAVLGAIGLSLRAFVYEPAAFVQDGLLHFNLEGVARYVLLATFAFVWMPLGTRVTQQAVIAKKVPQFSGAIAVIFIISLVCAALFMSARQNTMIIATFTALAFCFLILALIPALINRYEKVVQKSAATLKTEGAHHGE